jgi:hypothetical protein
VNRVRGSTVLYTKRYILQQGGPEMLVRVMRELGPADRQAMRRAVDAAAWIPFDAFLAFADATERLLGNGDGAVHRAIGRETARHDLQPIYQRVAAGGLSGVAPGQVGTIADITLFIGFVAELWRQYFSTGMPVIEQNEPGEVVIRLADLARPARALCERVIGFMQQAAEGAGVVGTEVGHPECVVQGGAACRFVLRWKPVRRDPA